MEKKQIKIKLDLNKIKREKEQHKETINLIDEFLSNKKGEKNE